MHAERLLNVARSLRESRTPEHFDMSQYTSDRCGTPGCALGHYAARQDLQDAFTIGGDGLVYAIGLPHDPMYFCHPFLLAHFQVTERQAEFLFTEHGCGDAKTAIDAAQYIEHLVRTTDNQYTERGHNGFRANVVSSRASTP